MKKPEKEQYKVNAEMFIDLESTLIPGAVSRKKGYLDFDVERAVALNSFLIGVTEFSDRIQISDILTKRPSTKVHKDKLTHLIQDAAMSDRWPSLNNVQFRRAHIPGWHLDETNKAKLIVEASRNSVVAMVDSNIAELGGCVLSAALESEEPLQPIVLGAVEHSQTAEKLHRLKYFINRHMPDVEVDESEEGSELSRFSMTRLTAASFTIDVVRIGDFSYDSGVAFSELVDEYCF